MKTQRILVWDIPTRVFHWSLAVSFATSYLTSESERLAAIHVTSGYILLGLIAFRLAWGFIGSRYARFSEFVRGPAAVIDYAKSLLAGRPRHFIGHNPAGAVAIVLLLVLGLATGATGYAMYNELGGEWLEEVHEACANAMLAVVVIHVLGVIASSLLHRENLVRAMITGRKDGTADEGIQRGNGFFALLLAGAVATFGWNSLQDATNAAPGKAGQEKTHDKHDKRDHRD